MHINLLQRQYIFCLLQWLTLINWKVWSSTLCFPQEWMLSVCFIKTYFFEYLCVKIRSHCKDTLQTGEWPGLTRIYRLLLLTKHPLSTIIDSGFLEFHLKYFLLHELLAFRAVSCFVIKCATFLLILPGAVPHGLKPMSITQKTWLHTTQEPT